MQKEKNNNVFELLADLVRSGLAELGFKEPTLPQILAFPPILERKNVLLIAPTGSGKTEAVLLPIFSKLVQFKKSDKKEETGIEVIYITPLRALNRDMIKRLSFWSNKLGISIEVRHGDTETRIRRKQAKTPPQILVTTPETLQAILPGSLMRKHLSKVKYVIIDEVHQLAESKRGTQLTLALERLVEVADEEFQRIGLSATVGNPLEVAKFISGSKRKIEVVQAVTSKSYRFGVENPMPEDSDYELASKLETAPEAAARIRRLIELVDSHKSTLIFVNSRTIAESLGHRFSQLNRDDFAVHHGSLSKQERIAIEDSFKSGALKAIICTSTLELGIDIGNVDLVIQYMSPRQVSGLIQRVGRSGHSLEAVSAGIIITVFPDDTIESIAAVNNAEASKIEPVLFHENALDVLAHQIAGILMEQKSIELSKLKKIIHRAYPYRRLKLKTLRDVLYFLDSLYKLRMDNEGKILRKTGQTREYYYGNLSMIPDERRYPVINVLSDRQIATVGDEFMALDARVGLNIILRGKVWRIVQIEEETGVVYVIPSDDPFAAVPGWDGEMLPVPFALAQETGSLREKIGQLLRQEKNAEQVAKDLSGELKTNQVTLLETVKEIEEQMNEGAPVPTHKLILLEVFDRYLIIHSCFGEVVNRTLGGIADAVLSEREVITGWWAEGYRILIETPRRLIPSELVEMPKLLFELSYEEVESYFKKYLKAKFPFAYKMKFIAERFGALPRGKTMSYERQSKLRASFENTPIYDETLREGLLEKADIARVKEITNGVKNGEIEIKTVFRSLKPTPLAYHILEKFSDVTELMAPERVILNNIDRMKKAIDNRTITLLCMKCGELFDNLKIKDLPSEPHCRNCNSMLLTMPYRSQNLDVLQEHLRKRLEGEEINPEELKELSTARRKADLILSYGKQAIQALQVKGVGPETASRILGKMHPTEGEFFMDLLKAKIQYLKTREFWEDKNRK